jgi:hypothetical protein
VPCCRRDPGSLTRFPVLLSKEYICAEVALQEGVRPMAIVKCALGFAFAILSSGCTNTNPNPNPNLNPITPVSNSSVLESPVAICGAGFDQSVQVGLAAELQRAGGKMTAGFQQSARSAIFNDASIASSDRQKMFDTYVDCVINLTSRTPQT